MDYHLVSALKSAAWLGIFAMATYLFIPKGIHAWELWKKTKKNDSSIECNRKHGISVFSLLSKFYYYGNETNWISMMKIIIFFAILIFSNEVCAKCSAVAESVKNAEG